MPFNIQLLENDSVLLTTLIGKFKQDIDPESFQKATKDAMNNLTSSVYYVLDLSQFTAELTTLIEASNAASRGDSPTFHNPNVREVIFVTTAPIMEITAQGMEDEIFGNLQIKLFPTLEEALAYTRR